jgi:hypothetical protein
LALPFLRAEEVAPERVIRNHDIAKEIEEYLDYVSQNLAPYAKLSLETFQALDLPDPPERPPLLETLDMVEKYGLPNPGSWFDQPSYWWADVEAARLGKWRYDQKQVQEVEHQARFENAPTPIPM